MVSIAFNLFNQIFVQALYLSKLHGLCLNKKVFIKKKT